MKFLTAFFFLSLNLQAATISQYISKPEGSSAHVFEIDEKKFTQKKASNFFDTKKDYRLGTFTAVDKAKAKELNTKLDSIYAKIKEVDTFMKKKSSSFNELADNKPHESFLALNEYRVTQDSVIYPELKAIYDEVAKLNWQQEKGIKLTEDFKKLITIENGKEVKREEFSFRFHCKDPQPPSVCAYKDLGIIYVQ